MAEYILKINARSKKAQQLINFLKTIDYVDIQEKKENKPMLPKETLQAIREMQNGDVVVCTSMEDYKRKVSHA